MMCQEPEPGLLTDDGEKTTPASYKGTKEGRERLRSKNPTEAEHRLYKPLKSSLKSYIKCGSCSLIFNTVTQVNAQSMDLLLFSQNSKQTKTKKTTYHASY